MTDHTVRLAGGRTIPFDECVGSTPIHDALGLGFDSAEDLARFVGRWWGYRSTTPTHQGMETDGVGWWVVDTMSTIYAETGSNSPGSLGYFDLVHGMEVIDNGGHATLVAIALEAAGLVVIPVEKAAGGDR